MEDAGHALRLLGLGEAVLEAEVCCTISATAAGAIIGGGVYLGGRGRVLRELGSCVTYRCAE